MSVTVTVIHSGEFGSHCATFVVNVVPDQYWICDTAALQPVGIVKTTAPEPLW